MILPIVTYGHPVLREKGRPVEKVTPEIRKLIQDMLETMYAARGIGLAAQQVGLALELTVIDVRGVTDRPSSLTLNNRPADVEAFMPLVLLNPKLQTRGDPATGPEGCLSFPELYADITRPESVDVVALNAEGEEIRFGCGGLLSRAVQHETDHLHGILFIDRMSTETRRSLRAELEALRTATQAALKQA